MLTHLDCQDEQPVDRPQSADHVICRADGGSSVILATDTYLTADSCTPLKRDAEPSEMQQDPQTPSTEKRRKKAPNFSSDEDQAILAVDAPNPGL